MIGISASGYGSKPWGQEETKGTSVIEMNNRKRGEQTVAAE